MRRNFGKLCLLLSVALLSVTFTYGVGIVQVFNVKNYGAKGTGKVSETAAINRTIEACAAIGGGMVVLPKGTYMTGTILMKSHVNLYLEEGTLIQGTDNLEEYQAYIPTRDMHKYGMAYRPGWTRALILAVGTTNSSITGRGTIDGRHVVDPKGEEGRRGPHGILFGECKNFEISGITIIRTGNYAFLGYEAENAVFHNLTIRQGFDGVHVRGGKNIIIRNCNFENRDDNIAGGYWENFSISECTMNSSCHALRVIFPVNDLEMGNCKIKGPGVHHHQDGKSKSPAVMLGAVMIQPGGWDLSPGLAQNIYIHDLEMDSVEMPVSVILNRHPGNSGYTILVERIRATNVRRSAFSVESWRGGHFDDIVFRDVRAQFVGSDAKNVQVAPPRPDPRKLPFWAFYANNAKEVTLENAEFTYTGTEERPAMGFENVGQVNLINVTIQEVPDVETIKMINSGTLVKK